jgi:hypothetical protein
MIILQGDSRITEMGEEAHNPTNDLLTVNYVLVMIDPRNTLSSDKYKDGSY